MMSSSVCLKFADPYPFSHFLSGAWSCLQQRRWLWYRWFCCRVFGRGIYICIHVFFSPCSALTKFYHTVECCWQWNLRSVIFNSPLQWKSSRETDSAKLHVIQHDAINYSKEFDPWSTWLKTDTIGLDFIVLDFYVCKTLFFLFITKFSIFSLPSPTLLFPVLITSYATCQFCC